MPKELDYEEMAKTELTSLMFDCMNRTIPRDTIKKESSSIIDKILKATVQRVLAEAVPCP